IQVNLDGVTTEGNNLVVNFTLINRSGREKKLRVRDRGIARTQDGEEYPSFLQVPETLMANDYVKGTLTIPDAASVNIRMARIPIFISERNIDFEAMLYF
ncbi:MAG: hypothetical protein K2M00_08170, partial [Muribaculaceae bacterium]|nr:hypothetical protein [Muribaculaceae bacterium]